MQDPHAVDQTLSALKAMSWTASLPFKGHFCHATNVFNASLETKYDLFQYTTSMYKGSKHIIQFSPFFYPITGGFGKDSGGHSLITDLLQAAKSIGNCALVSNGYGLCSPTNVTDVLLTDQRILKCSNFRKYLSEQGGMSSTLNESTGTDSYCVTTYTGDKKNARGCKSSGIASIETLQFNSTWYLLQVPLEVAETSAFKKYALESRLTVGAREDQDILIACCWVLPEGRRLFHAFPEVVCVDGTHETNNESRPLLTLSVKDSNGKLYRQIMDCKP
jgi:hypothetical protein